MKTVCLPLCAIIFIVACFIGFCFLMFMVGILPTVPITEPSKPTAVPSPTVVVTPLLLVPTAQGHANTLKILEDTLVPVNDPLDLARRLEGKQNLPSQLAFPLESYQIGDRKSFWVTNSDTNENFQVQAALRYITGHAYFWIEVGVDYEEKELRDVAETFEKKIYPTNRLFFGSEWTPGVDADPHLYILYARGLGKSIAGYFSSVDEYLPMVREDANGHEMFLLSADNVKLDDEYMLGVLAHEFQHMIHWYRDRNEESWLNEGFSELAMFLNGFDIGGSDRAYLNSPDIQLTYWPQDPDSAHYGASFLFITYFLDRFGEEATKALVSDPDNGMASIDDLLRSQNALDPLTGQPLSADDLFADWVVANYLNDKRVADGRYFYNNYPRLIPTTYTEEIRTCPQPLSQRGVSQYGVDYIRIRCQGDFNLHFQGATQVGIFPVEPYSGSYVYYSNQGDESDMTLTRSFDFTNQTGPLTLSYYTWYDLEEDYDYLYLLASLDGENWQILTTPSGTAEDPSGNSFGWAYNGASGGGPRWIREQVDLSSFAGKKVQLRFEYVTDAAVNGVGFLLDDVAIPQTGYFTDFEADDGGWQASGFVRVQNVLPQFFRVTLIRKGQTIKVEYVQLDANNSAIIPLDFSSDLEEAILAVSGVTRHTYQKTIYQFSISP